MPASESDFDTFIEEIEYVNAVQPQPMEKYTGAIPKNSSPPSALIATRIAEHLPINFKKTVDMINKGLRVCVIMRGLPGSGKSFLAHEIIEETVKATENRDDHILSADKYFMVRGRYLFKQENLSAAHDFCQRLFTQRASQGMSPLIVDNTNMMYWEMYYYLQVAVQYGYHIEIMEPNTPWKSSEKKLALKNIHSVPFESINRMKNKYENGLGVEAMLHALQLDIVRQPKMRNIPPIVKKVAKEAEVVKDLIDFGQKPTTTNIEWKLYDPSATKPPPKKNIEWQTPEKVVPDKKAASVNWKSFQQNFDDEWDLPKELAKEKVPPGIEKATPKQETEPQSQSQRKKAKNKQNRSPPLKLSPHRKNCPNENSSFSQIRELYPTVNDSYLWDLFERCKGDADWCVNLLCDENLTDQMDAGSDLSCACFGSNVTKAVVNETKENTAPNHQQGQSSPTFKSKKAKAEVSKQIDLGEWLGAKELIEKSITIGEEHYPEHVNQVKNWRKGLQAPVEPAFANADVERPESPKTSISPDIGDELHSLTISNELITELDEEYGGGCLKNIVNNKHKFPPKIFIRKSTAMQLYLEIMEAYYSQEEEARLEVMKNDEELAKKLNEQQMNENAQKPPVKGSKKNNGAKDVLKLLDNVIKYESELLNTWTSQESSDDMALKMSKDKLIEMFPGINKNMLMEIFAGANHDFNETVELIQDSLNCTPQERKEIAQVQKKVFNAPWQAPDVTNDPGDEKAEETKVGYTSEHLKTVENLRQEIKDHHEEQQVCYQKARDAIQKKNYELATYLSNIANFHKMKADEAKHEVANLMAGIHENTQKSDTVLDLHFLNLVEAVTLLDTFLDKNISRLRAIKKPYEDIHIITGRGLHSANGVATIKNKTKSRLRERNLT